MVEIQTQDITVKYSKQVILDKLNIKLQQGKITAILGPNGSGKSTLLKTLVGLVPHQEGKIIINDKKLANFPKIELAKILSILPQSPDSPNDITVKQLVSYGRHAHSSWFKKTKKDDNFYVDWALDATNLTQLSDNYIYELSGGQKQRSWIAMSLAQNSNYLFLDEPTTYLDIHYQFEILSLLRDLNKKQNKTIIMVLHELQNAIQYADHIIVLDKGSVVADDTTKNVLASKILDDVFKVRIKQVHDENNQSHIVICDQTKESQ
ncbi:MAG: ABC transporter ATP-binding protein [Burkholderiales bacterium]|nr:ABC transporter ATP-binding protein [Burkholderiales bacterium]